MLSYFVYLLFIVSGSFVYVSPIFFMLSANRYSDNLVYECITDSET